MTSAILVALALSSAFDASAQSDGRPQIRIAPRILVEAETETPLMVHVGPPEAVPARSYVQLRGLPESAQLNEGHNVSPGVWAIPMRSLTNLTINAPQAATGTTDLVARLVSVEGTVLTEVRATMIVAPGFQLSQRSAAREQPQARVQPQSQTADRLRERLAPPPAPPAAAEPPARPMVVLPPDERTRLEKLVALGNRHLGNGNIAAAREFFRRAAEGGLAEGAMLLATTYDPAELNAIKVQGLAPDLAEARRWYERARELGAAGADARLARLR